MTTWAELMSHVLVELNVLRLGERMDAPTKEWMLEKCQEMIDGWAADAFLIPGHERASVTLGGGEGQVPASQKIVIGPSSSDFGDESHWPLEPIPYRMILGRIHGFGNTQPVPMVKYDLLQYNDARNSSVTVVSTPSAFYYERKFDRGLLYFNLIPTAGVWVELTYQSDLPGSSPIDDDGNNQINLPPGYKKAIRYNMALEMAPSYDIAPERLRFIGKHARDSLRQVRALMGGRVEMRIPPEWRSRGTRMIGRRGWYGGRGR